ESACGFCIGNSMSPKTESVSFRTSNRNFKGRSGTASANVYLASPVVAAAAALRGEIVDPRDLGMEFPRVRMPDRFKVDDGMIVRPLPEGERAKVTIYRGPNIGAPSTNDPMPQDLRGKIAIKVDDYVTTDHIMPAGSRLKYRSNVPKYSEFVFEPLDPEFSKRAAERRDRGIANLIAAGVSYGQGSSREHAALCPMYLGVKAVIAKSIERIHAANLVNFGIVPFTFVSESDYDLLSKDDDLEIPGIREALEEGAEVVEALDRTAEERVLLKTELSQRQRDIIVAGGLLPYTVRNKS
ncbi:MAG: aconitase family protein, partial [Methanothrix sp.]|nr:aconitase family protein [Methanothrix sp.]